MGPIDSVLLRDQDEAEIPATKVIRLYGFVPCDTDPNASISLAFCEYEETSGQQILTTVADFNILAVDLRAAIDLVLGEGAAEAIIQEPEEGTDVQPH